MTGTAPPAVTSVLRLHKASELVAEPVTWTVDQIIPTGMLTVLSGKDKVGKTLLAWEMARTVTCNEAFLGHFLVKQGPVIFLALDDPAVVTVERLEQISLSNDTDLHVATPLDCQHRDPEFWEQVRTHVKDLGAALLIVDALYLFLPQGPDTLNQAGAMHPVMATFNKLTEKTGVSIVLITHDTKSGMDVAGSFVIRAAARQILRLSAPDGGSSKRVLKVEGKIIEAGEWTLNFSGPGQWKLVNSEAEKLGQTKAAVTAWLQKGQVGTVEEIAKAVEKRRADVGTVLMQLEAEGLVKAGKVVSGKGRPRHVYRWIFGPDPGDTGRGTEKMAKKYPDAHADPALPVQEDTFDNPDTPPDPGKSGMSEAPPPASPDDDPLSRHVVGCVDCDTISHGTGRLCPEGERLRWT